MRWTRDIHVLCALLLLTFCSGSRAGSHPGAPPVPIIPAPAEAGYREGSFAVTADTPVYFSVGTPSEETARYFMDLLARTRDLRLGVGPNPETGSPRERSPDSESPAFASALRFARPGSFRQPGIRFRHEPGVGPTSEEAYSLTVSSDGIVVSSGSRSGLFYGAVSLWQLLTADSAARGPARIPAVEIRDRPRFRWRGLMLDSARHYQSPAFIKRFIDLMALHKLNVLHWHLTDDQAWRLEIERYPRLTSFGAWRVPAGPAAAADVDPATGQPRRYGGFYSRDQVHEIVAFAAARYVTIVPEIEMPGHASAAIAAYPELGVDGHAPGAVPADWGVYDNVFNVEDSTFAFLENVLREVISLFPGEYVHIGGDEAVKDQWRQSERVQSRMRALGLHDEEALQSYFVRRIGAFLDTHDRRLIGWDEILEGAVLPEEGMTPPPGAGLPANAMVMSWRGTDGAVAAAAAGHDAVLSPAPTLYFDHRPVDAPRPPGRGKVVGIEDVYRFDPAPGSLNEAQRRHILGVQANVWTEHIRTADRLEYMTFPRAAALAEVAWSAPERIDWSSFTARLAAQRARYQALDVNYARPAAAAPPWEDRRTSHQLTPCSEKLVLSLEDDAPVDGDRAVFLVDIMNPCWIYQDADLTEVTEISASVGQVPFNFRIGDDVEQIPLPEPRTAAGELQVRLDRCDGDLVAALPLAPAAERLTVTSLPPAALDPRAGEHDLCLMFTRDRVDPIWVIDAIELGRRPAVSAPAGPAP